MAPDGQAKSEEQACCRMMKSQCGQMEMPVSHDCCKKAPAGEQAIVLKSDKPVFHPGLFALICVSYWNLLPPHNAIVGSVPRPEHSPPEAPPSAITILRI
jgi:hypothetical protein